MAHTGCLRSGLLFALPFVHKPTSMEDPARYPYLTACLPGGATPPVACGIIGTQAPQPRQDGNPVRGG